LIAAGQEAIERGHVPITPRDVQLAKAVDAADLALLNACLEVEADLTEQACAALERLLALLPPGGNGTLSERVAALPQPAFAVAVLALMERGLDIRRPGRALEAVGRRRYCLATLSNAATIATILASLGIGGLVGAWATAWHERTEKFRDRTIEACVDFLEKENVARQRLSQAETDLLSDDSSAQPVGQSEARKQLQAASEACRILQTQVYRLSLLFAGGSQAPAVKDSHQVAVFYYLWRDALYDFAVGKIDAPTARRTAKEYFDRAKWPYNDFADDANALIRPRLMERLRRRRRIAETAN
jgi:hypothetical protein